MNSLPISIKKYFFITHFFPPSHYASLFLSLFSFLIPISFTSLHCIRSRWHSASLGDSKSWLGACLNSVCCHWVCTRFFLSSPDTLVLHSFTCGTVCDRHTNRVDNWIQTHSSIEQQHLFSRRSLPFFHQISRLLFQANKTEPDKNGTTARDVHFYWANIKIADLFHQHTDNCEQFSFFVRMKIYDQLLKTEIRNIKQQQTELLRNLS